jgi:hypothetical protein
LLTYECDNKSQTVVNTGNPMLSGFTSAGQAFIVNESYILSSIKFYLTRVGSPSGNVVAKVYAITGTPSPSGSGAIPTGLALAISESVAANTITTTMPGGNSPTEFNFTGTNKIRLINNVGYAFVVEYNDGITDNFIYFGSNNTEDLRENENIVVKTDAWYPYMPMGYDDASFIVYGTGIKYPLPPFRR